MSVKVRVLDAQDADFAQRLRAVLAFEESTDDAIEGRVAAILADVKTRGDAAVLEYTAQFDKVDVQGATSLGALEISQAEMQAALNGLSPERRNALQTAA
ncbi:MAG TPA: histidinol dehydrogenase, partial [Burkholderiaceae bacterium]